MRVSFTNKNIYFAYFDAVPPICSVCYVDVTATDTVIYAIGIGGIIVTAKTTQSRWDAMGQTWTNLATDNRYLIRLDIYSYRLHVGDIYHNILFI